ncbi:MAG: enoyl-CoA hydratase-related protein [Undibacterium sp.]|nr:enoyl-CoA hydratase-related protein [Undibacterium sp.]MDO8701109.1 enoyl-CoA hydratase-related protein [Undibacterium sp.]MDO9194342.1 enoyl-CoA hydratase-related protein [Undibacterium sp.]
MSNIFCKVTDQIAFVTLSNPGKLNALDVSMWTELREQFNILSLNEDLRCIILNGADGNFAAGADIEEFATVRNNISNGMFYHNNTVALALQAISDCRHPVIAAIEGICVGGGLEIACSCDIRISTPTARFGIPVNRLGFPLAPEELRGLIELTGKAVALEIVLEGRVFDALEAKDKGLLHRLSDNVPDEALTTALRIAKGAPMAARINKQLVKRLTASSAPLSEDEAHQVFAFLESNDYREGVASFLGKRSPQFTGK